jgi:GNAT superfamily N-acetyltransferase
MKINAAIRTARSQDMAACAAIVNSWIDDTPWMPRIHSHEDVARFYKKDVLEQRKVFVVASSSQIIGVMALDTEHTVTALYVAKNFRSQGVGRLLLDRAKTESRDGVKLWTFQANEPARRFYLREGFSEVNRTDGDNEEGLPDILLEWRG